MNVERCKRNGCHRQVRGIAVGDRHRRQLGTVREADTFRTLPANPLEIRDQNRFPPRQCRLAQDAAGQLQGRTVPCRAGAWLDSGDGSQQAAAIGSRAQRHFGVRCEQDDRAAIRRLQTVDRVLRCRERFLPPPAESHAVRTIEEHDDFASAAAARGCRVRAPEERTPECEHQQRQRRQAHREQEPVPDPASLHRLIRNPSDEHQRRELHDIAALFLNQMQHHRNRESREADEEERRQKRHHRTRDSLSRAER